MYRAAFHTVALYLDCRYFKGKVVGYKGQFIINSYFRKIENYL